MSPHSSIHSLLSHTFCIVLFILCVTASSCERKHSPRPHHNKVELGQASAIELLKVKVNNGQVKAFMDADKKVWTPFLEKYPAFLGKEYWLEDSKRGILLMVIYWKSVKGWKSIPQAEQDKTYAKFYKLFPKDGYSFVSSKQFSFEGAYDEDQP